MNIIHYYTYLFKDESPGTYAECEEANSKGVILYDFIYTAFSKWKQQFQQFQNFGNGEQFSGCQ